MIASRPLYWLASKHPRVRSDVTGLKTYQCRAFSLRYRVELLNSKLRAAEAVASQANRDAQMLYDHYQEAVEIIAMYQGSMRTLMAPDPHEARVRTVVTDFLKQFKDRYA
jgi:hypothetical protein